MVLACRRSIPAGHLARPQGIGAEDERMTWHCEQGAWIETTFLEDAMAAGKDWTEAVSLYLGRPG